MHPDYTSDDDERHSWHSHHTVIDIAEIVAAVRDNLIAEESATTKELADGSHDDEYHAIAQTVGKAIDKGWYGLILHSERLKTTHQNTVGDDKADIYRELDADIIDKRLEHLRDDGYEGCNNHQLNHDTDAVRDGIAKQRDDKIAESGDDRYGNAHDEGWLEL